MSTGEGLYPSYLCSIYYLGAESLSLMTKDLILKCTLYSFIGLHVLKYLEDGVQKK